MCGHPAITLKRLLTGTAGVLAYDLLCAGPPDTMMGTPPRLRTGFRQGWWGADMFSDVCCHVRGRTWHTLGVPRTWRAWRGLEHAAHLAQVEHVAHLAHQRCLARLGPKGAWRTWRAWHAWRTSPQRRAHGVGVGSQ